MAQYNVTHKCGCIVTHKLFGKQDARYSRIEWLEGTDCLACQNVAAADKNSNLVALDGSEKQIAWAESIRAERMGQLVSIEEKIANAPEGVQKDNAIKAVELVKSIASASKWIETRDMSVEALLATTFMANK